MEPISAAIIVALSASAASGVSEITRQAIQDGYNGLKALITKKLGNQSEAAEAIEKLEAKPESEGRRQTVAEELKDANLSSDPELVSAAQSLLELMKALPQAGPHIQHAVGTGIAQADRGSTASVTLGTPPAAKGGGS